MPSLRRGRGRTGDMATVRAQVYGEQEEMG